MERSGGPPEWRGRQGDGRELMIERGLAATCSSATAMWPAFVSTRSFDISPARLASPGLDWQRVLIGKVIPSISVMRGYEALHAAAVDSPDGVVAIMAPSGSGKSTLALELVRRGLAAVRRRRARAVIRGVVSSTPTPERRT